IMIRKEISSHVLTLGTDCRVPKGGVAMVLNSYSNIYEPFRFVATTRHGSTITKLLTLCKAYVCVLWLCVFGGIEVVHIHGASYNSFWRKRVFISLVKFLGKKVVYHIHGGGFRDFTEKNKTAVVKTLHKCDCIVALSDSWRNYFVNELSCTNVKVIKNIVPSPQIEETEKDEVLHFMILGLVCEQKGIFDLIQAVKRLKETVKEKFVLHIGGLGETERLQREIKENDLTDCVHFEGFVANSDKVNLLNRCDFYVLPSYTEGLPISILEAMSYSLPIVSTPVGGIPEVVDDANGILVQSGDVDALTSALKKMITDKQMRQSMGERSWQKVQPHLPENVEKELTEMYEKLLKI
ncbi:MAG: glycosyltransferase family 4 protein, partial [Bacteroidaceae bacterium]